LPHWQPEPHPQFPLQQDMITGEGSRCCCCATEEEGLVLACAAALLLVMRMAGWARRGINRPGRRSGGRQTAAGGLKEWTRASQGPPRHHHCLFILQMKVTAEDGIDAVILI